VAVGAVFRSAGGAGIMTWELDVHFDVNGTPVVLHDDTVDRVSPSTGPIAELDASEHGIPTDDGQYIPTLREVYELAQRYGAHVLSEIKVMPTEAEWAAAIKVYAWTVDNEADWQKLSAWPVDAIITNKPIAYRQWAQAGC
jgi:glycerophosphoryl diester phosphodiesterase